MLLLLGMGCFRVTVMPGCEETSRSEVADSQETLAGSADQVLAHLEMDQVVGATWQDGATVDAWVQVVRAGGRCLWPCT